MVHTAHFETYVDGTGAGGASGTGAGGPQGCASGALVKADVPCACGGWLRSPWTT